MRRFFRMAAQVAAIVAGSIVITVICAKPDERAVFLDNPWRSILIVIAGFVGLFFLGVAICSGIDLLREPPREPPGFEVLPPADEASADQQAER